MAADRWDEQVGTVADEAARLLESLRSMTAEQDTAGGEDTFEQSHRGDGTESPGPDRAPGGAPDPGHDPVCQWCPLCRGAAVVRSLSPETLARLADLAVLAAGVLADLSARQGPTASGTSGAGGDAGERGSRRPAPSPPKSRPVPVVDIDVPEEGPHA